MPRGPGGPKVVSKSMTRLEMREVCQKIVQTYELTRQSDSFGDDISDEEMELYNSSEMDLSRAARAAKRLLARID